VKLKILVSSLVVLVVALAAVSVFAVRRVQSEQHTNSELRTSLRASQGKVDDLGKIVDSNKGLIASLEQKVDAAPHTGNCSLVRYAAGGLLTDERILVICGPHAKDATDAVVEYRIRADDAAEYLASRYPLDKILLDGSLPGKG
jgi:hypothetical protein